ncbi:MAG: 3-deoxy-manno-octulosonate cytidylyltransferase [Desulfovibrionaceae bacterium]|nr:3-deoxy-manno-octulosonate cytidylyltransferase [Desulfovibrionaceae bacterium]
MPSPFSHNILQGRVHAIIPSRYASTRFPGKPLTLLHGKPMFWHVWSRAMRCPVLSSVTLATDDERIKEAADALAVPVLMTGCRHQSGTDRVHEAALLLGLPENAVVINIQGDEPALDPEALTLLAGAFSDPLVQAATLAHVLDPADLMRPDKVKVVLAANGDALYFSRAGIPFSRDGERALPVYGHIGLYAFTMRTLNRFVALAPSPLERTEKLEQLRLLENNIPIRVLLTDKSFIGVDQVEDVARVLPLL